MERLGEIWEPAALVKYAGQERAFNPLEARKREDFRQKVGNNEG